MTEKNDQEHLVRVIQGSEAVTEAIETSEDQAIPEDEAIRAAHPTRSGRHGLYQVALRLVGAKKSKKALVELVNWLLLERSDLGQLVLEALPYVEVVRAQMPDRDSEKWAKWVKSARKATARRGSGQT